MYAHIYLHLCGYACDSFGAHVTPQHLELEDIRPRLRSARCFDGKGHHVSSKTRTKDRLNRDLVA